MSNSHANIVYWFLSLFYSLKLSFILNIDFNDIKLVYEVYKILSNDCVIIDCNYMLTTDMLINIKNNYLHNDLDVDLSTVKSILKGINYNKLTKAKLIEYLNECCNLINNIIDDNRYIDLLKSDSREYYNTIYTNCCKYICSYNEYARKNNKIFICSFVFLCKRIIQNIYFFNIWTSFS